MSTFGIVHTALSFLALGVGVVVVAGLLAGKSLPGWTALFLASAVATSATGLAFPGFGIAHALGIPSLAALAIAILARYAFGLAGVWRRVYAVAVVLSLYGLVFFTIGEAFLRIPALKAMAPTLTELPFGLAQLVALVLFIAIAVKAARSSHHQSTTKA